MKRTFPIFFIFIWSLSLLLPGTAQATDKEDKKVLNVAAPIILGVSMVAGTYGVYQGDCNCPDDNRMQNPAIGMPLIGAAVAISGIFVTAAVLSGPFWLADEPSDGVKVTMLGLIAVTAPILAYFGGEWIGKEVCGDWKLFANLNQANTETFAVQTQERITVGLAKVF